MLLDLLIQNKEVVVRSWQRAIMDTYPGDTPDFLDKQKDRFANPVGHAIVSETAPLLDELIGDMDRARIDKSLTDIIRIRAIQDFTPSQAVAFVGLLRPIVRELLAEKTMTDALFTELSDFESRLDTIQNAAFDIYSECRGKLAEIRVNATKRKHAKLVEKLSGHLSEPSADESHTLENN